MKQYCQHRNVSFPLYRKQRVRITKILRPNRSTRAPFIKPVGGLGKRWRAILPRLSSNARPFLHRYITKSIIIGLNMDNPAIVSHKEKTLRSVQKTIFYTSMVTLLVMILGSSVIYRITSNGRQINLKNLKQVRILAQNADTLLDIQIPLQMETNQLL